MTRGLFATMLERADTKEAIGLNRSRLRSTRPWHHRTPSKPRFRSAKLIQTTPPAFRSAISCPRRRRDAGENPVYLTCVPEVDRVSLYGYSASTVYLDSSLFPVDYSAGVWRQLR
jgi:hypothetical protein